MRSFLKIAAYLSVYLAVVSGAAFISFPSSSEAQKFREQPQEIFSYNVDGTLPENVAPQDISVLIVPHHLVADKQMRNAFARTAAARKHLKTRRIILMGPNHFFRGESQVITDTRDWETNYGTLSADASFISLLLEKNFAEYEPGIAKGDHSITALLPFIARFFPEAEFVPLLVREPMPRASAKALGDFFARELSDEDLIVASIDFSHYFSKDVADAHDKESIEALQKLDIDFLEKKIDADSRQILMALAYYLKARGRTTFTLLDHTNSAVLTGNPYEKSTTSHILGYYSGGNQGFPHLRSPR